MDTEFAIWITLCSCKNRWYLQRYCRRCWNKIWHSNFELDQSLPEGKNKKVIGLIKDELHGQIMKKLVELRAKRLVYLKENNDEDKKAKDTKKCFMKKPLNLKAIKSA